MFHDESKYHYYINIKCNDWNGYIYDLVNLFRSRYAAFFAHSFWFVTATNTVDVGKIRTPNLRSIEGTIPYSVTSVAFLAFHCSKRQTCIARRKGKQEVIIEVRMADR